MAYYFSRRWTEAAPLLEKACAWSLGGSTLFYTLGMSHLYSHERDQARQAFAKLFAVPADSPRALMLSADLMYQEEYANDAEALYQEIRKKWPDFPELEYNLGLIALTKRDFPSVVEHMRAELARNPVHPMAWHYLGDALFKQGKLDEAAETLQRAAWLNSRSAKSFVTLAQVYTEQNNFAMAESSLKHALTLEPQDYQANFLLARLYFKTNRPDLAKQQMAIAERLRKPTSDAK
jgi:predicted Zn-dependent protease